MSNKKKREIILTEDLIEAVKKSVEIRQKRLITTLNQAVSSLFFNIGAELNREAENVHSIDKKSILIQEIADSLQPIFGNHLCSQNLFLMSKFADECSSEKRRFVAAIINWDYLPYFLNLTEDDEWVFYSDLIYSKSLTPIELGRKISDKTFEKTEKKLSTDKYDFMFKKAYAFYRSTLELYFGKEGRDSFRKLFEPQDVHKDYQDNLTTKKTVHNELLLSIYTKITEFQSEYNHQLNLGFNILIWALGVEIIKLSKSSKAKNINDVIDLCIQEFSNDLPSIFNQKELSHCIDFVNEYGENNNPPIELMQILPWAYLKILIKIEGYENQFLLANQILKNGVSIQELEKLISDGSFNLEKAKQELEKITMNNSVAEIITKEKNFTATGTMSIIEPIVNLENDLNRNIYKNPDLLAFLAHNAYMNDRTLK